MSIGSEFKEFIARGNVIDLAVGVIIGGAFGKIVTSLVDQVIMPPLGMALGRVDFSQLKIVLQEAGADPKVTPEVAILYGAFINTLIQFLIVAFVIFMMVKAINTLRRQEAEALAEPAAPTTTEALLTEIRDSLKPKAAPVAAKAAPAPKAKPVAKAPARKPPARKR